MPRGTRVGRDGALYIGLRRSDGEGLDEVVIPGRSKTEFRGTLTGNIHQHDLQSEILEGERRVMVYLPPGYSDKNPWRYPVLYLNDGQNVFDVATSAFGVEWRVDETAEHLIMSRAIQPIMIVAVYNSPDRFEEYTPTVDEHHGGGGADQYGDFLIREVKPFIEKTYRASPVADTTTIMGSSLGGLCAIYLGWKHPEVFGTVAALSPSLWWAGRDLMAAMAGDESGRGPARIWLDMGTEESDEDENRNLVPDTLDDVRLMKAVLLAKGYKLGENFFYREVKGAYHDEASWAARVGEILRALYPPAPAQTFLRD